MPDVFTVGEAMLRLNAPVGSRLDNAGALDVHAAGSEANVAVALARLGRSVTWFSALPEGPLGRRVSAEFARHGVDVSTVCWVPDTRLGVFYTEVNPPPHRTKVLYDRKMSAASHLDVGDVPWDAVVASRMVHLSGITPAISTSCLRMSQEVVARARRAGLMMSVDVNYRAKLWSPQEARAALEPLVENVGLLVVNREDANDVFGLNGEPETILLQLADTTGAANAVVTLGSSGAVWRSPNGSGHVPGVAAEVVDRIGAGDAFTAGVIDGLLDGDLERGVRFGVAMGALAVASKGDQLLSTRTEIEELLSRQGRSVDR